jgi:prolyl-tRNA editing enzyme YbaK/EbsC (Cys-tRNA(Pro) deacylase)
MTSLHQLDFQAQHEATLREAELEKSHSEFVAFHTEYREVLHDFMQALLLHKPQDPLAFMSDYFQKHREKREPYRVK